MTTTHERDRSNHAGTARRSRSATGIASRMVVAASAALTLAAPIASGTSSIAAPVSLDQRPTSILLDGAAFEAAVAGAIASFTNGAALLDGAAFAVAVTDAVAEPPA